MQILYLNVTYQMRKASFIHFQLRLSLLPECTEVFQDRLRRLGFRRRLLTAT
jgi:hypothetical protein